MSNETDLRKHFEAIVGYELEGDLENDVALRDTVSVYYRTKTGYRTSREIGTTGTSTKGCGETGVLTIGGLVRTGADGTATRLLSDFHCESDEARRRELVDIVRPFVFVVTPRSHAPVFATCRSSLVQTNGFGDIRFEIATFNAGGDPAAGIAVAWHCLAAYEEVIGGVD